MVYSVFIATPNIFVSMIIDRYLGEICLNAMIRDMCVAVTSIRMTFL